MLMEMESDGEYVVLMEELRVSLLLLLLFYLLLLVVDLLGLAVADEEDDGSKEEDDGAPESAVAEAERVYPGCLFSFLAVRDAVAIIVSVLVIWCAISIGILRSIDDAIAIGIFFKDIIYPIIIIIRVDAINDPVVVIIIIIHVSNAVAIIVVIEVFVIQYAVIVVIRVFVVVNAVTIIIVVQVVHYAVSVKVEATGRWRWFQLQSIVSILIRNVLGKLHWVYDGSKQKGNSRNYQSVNGDSVILVFLVRICTSQTESCQEGPEKVCEDSNDDQGSDSPNVTC